MKKLIKILPVLILACGIGLGIYAVSVKVRYNSAKRTYEEIAGTYTVTEKAAEPVNGGNRTTEDSSGNTSTATPFPVDVDFAGLQATNSSVVGWIYCADTEINYPIVIGTDNIYYLTHGIKKEENISGSIFMDAGNSGKFTDPNNIIYGHHMADGTMFASVSNYKKQEFYDKHPCMYLAAPDRRYRLDIYSCYVTEENSEAYRIRFKDIDDYAAWLEKTINTSLITAECLPNISTYVCTLSTCSYEFTGARCVVHAVLTPVG